MSITRRKFMRGVGAGVLGASALSAVGGTAGMRLPLKEGSLKLLKLDQDAPPLADFDRLPLDWHKRTVKRFREILGEKGVDAAVLQNRWNIIYFTGLFHSTTERPFTAVFPVHRDALFWFHPGLDRDLIDSWWSSDNEYYFDYLHADGGFPNKGVVQQGRTVDLWQWTLEGIRNRGLGEGSIGFDRELTPSEMETVRKVMPKARVVNIAPVCMRMRIVKTPEEIALIQRAYHYFSRIHAYARDYILEKGTDATDFEVAHAAEEYGVNLIMEDIKRDGKPHTAVGIGVGISCRTGVATAYPHPNQFYHKKIEKGDSLQVSGGVRIGGYGGELYRYFQIFPWDAHREKVWDVVTECVNIQARESRHGVTCSSVAYKIHQYQVENGMQELIYHRPAHGEGMEGHQPPWLALGDYTMLEEGMAFSVEPGLYDPKNGFGYNPSDTCLVTRDRGLLLSAVPYTREWMFLRL